MLTVPAAKDGGTIILKEGKVGTPSSDEKIDISDVVTNGTGSVTVSVQTAAIVRPVEPTYKKLDGTVVRGWLNVVKEAYNTAMLDAVPLAPTAQAAKEMFVDIELTGNVIKMIPQNAVNEMKNTGATYRFILSDQVTYEFDHAALAKIQSGLNLDMIVSTDKDLGQGFKTLVIDPKKDENINAKVYMNFGKENEGKVAFIFHRNLTTKKIEYLSFAWIDSMGNVKVEQADYTDLVVLY